MIGWQPPDSRDARFALRYIPVGGANNNEQGVPVPDIVVAFVHGWSVTDKGTYGRLPEAPAAAGAAAGVDIETRNIYLGRYISFHDEVTIPDLARAMNHAVAQDLKGVSTFSCITHSTGGPLVRAWVDIFYGAKRLDECPLKHLVMLAPANHGSALGVLGKERVGRIKSFFEGVEPGQGVLDWLCLGSSGAWDLADRFTYYTLKDNGFYPFVLSGETIDKRFYDFVNSYLREEGSDGVVRLAGANMNYTFFRLEQTEDRYSDVAAADDDEGPETQKAGYILKLVQRPRSRPPETAFGVIPDASHSGDRIGIMGSVTPANAATKPVVDEILKCLKVETDAQYAQRITDLATATEKAQKDAGPGHRRFVMFVFRVSDKEGLTIGDYDLFLLGDDFRRRKLPPGFFVDRQKNSQSQALVYYLDYDKLIQATHLGIRVDARPVYSEPEGAPTAFAGYLRAEFRLSGSQFKKFVNANEAVYVDIVLRRIVDTETFRFERLGTGKDDFEDADPAGPVPSS